MAKQQSKQQAKQQSMTATDQLDNNKQENQSQLSASNGTGLPFNNIYRHGFVRVAAATPQVHLAAPQQNGAEIVTLFQQAEKENVALTIFPELCLSGYSIDDLLQQSALQQQVEEALAQLCKATSKAKGVMVVGAPLMVKGALYNTAIAIQAGRILGVVPKSYLPNYREFYEKRHFIPAAGIKTQQIRLNDQLLPFGTKLLFSCQNIVDFCFALEICEDVWTPIPPSTYAALAGATILANLSASNVTIGKARYRRDLCKSQSGRTLSAYIYSASGFGESTNDLAWDGDAFVVENAQILAENTRFATSPNMTIADVDVQRLMQERSRTNSFHDSTKETDLSDFTTIPFAYMPTIQKLPLQRDIERFPFVPSHSQERDERCEEAYQIQVQGLMQRLQASGINKIIIGISGGLDSTQALLVAVRTFDALELPRENILAYTMPGYATSSGTKSNAWALMEALGVSAEEIDIRPSCEQMLKDLKHPFTNGEPVYDITFENVQAGQRTSHLFRLANHHGGLVLGTGDLSELALGWCTYGVGDHMSHYNVNTSLPKTLIRHLLRWEQAGGVYGDAVNQVLGKIIDTEISPELVPGESNAGQPSQSTEAVIGPYPLQDFNLYYITRYGFSPSKVAFLAAQIWTDSRKGHWPVGTPESEQVGYELREIKKWLEKFLWRFFQTSQFKRTAVPNGPKVGSGGSLSPRGDWRAPSDSSAQIWVEELKANVPNRL